MRPHLIRTRLREQVDLVGRPLNPDGWNRPLDEYTAEAISDYLACRHERRPNSTILTC
ncbi:hypothetical protein [Streptomyces sp. NPDC008150]|uniref:hypothetical protein n=1 Tax=Streptomyces sp. NPDC008150 TaxID=3364816 RepID=UPI0036EE6921